MLKRYFVLQDNNPGGVARSVKELATLKRFVKKQLPEFDIIVIPDSVVVHGFSEVEVPSEPVTG